MKKLMRFILLLSATTCNAEVSNEPACLHVLREGIRARAVERACGFEHGIGARLNRLYHETGCQLVLRDQDVLLTAEIVLTGLRQKHKKLGYEFCGEEAVLMHDLTIVSSSPLPSPIEIREGFKIVMNPSDLCVIPYAGRQEYPNYHGL